MVEMEWNENGVICGVSDNVSEADKKNNKMSVDTLLLISFG